ncbi:hypothetical protein Vadar_018598 [Vaccinium darrowii]|uniref:Uncharacterized protein n=1 Tax=Vaccinium darrowii TaxID=229202 RepID=A0ACB7ZDI9_9ERIC|nr:hypothetical protein Vadar_018598 [Vaccinium darrowii]
MEASLPCFLPIISISFFFFFTNTASSLTFCLPQSCAETGPVIQFPFRIKNSKPARCGYPGYDLYCNNKNQTILTLPHSGPFVVNGIDYFNQLIYINDPGSCLPRRILNNNFTLSGPRFRPVFSINYTLYNCSADYISPGSVPVFCLRSANFKVLAVKWGGGLEKNGSVPAVCRNFSTIKSPVELTAVNPIGDTTLEWFMPAVCLRCGDAGGCEYAGESANGCLNLPPRSDSRGLPRSAKYGIIIGVGIPGLVCLIGLVCFACGKIRMYGQRHRLEAQLSNLTSNPLPMVIVTGLDGPTIESYHKTVLGESRRLPNPNDGTCPICLAEYQPKETLRTIPDCNHYFHANCIDEWLRINATCPLCRNTPSESSVVTPSSSMSSSSSSAS